MPSEQDKATDGVNIPLLITAGIIAIVGFFLSITIALMWVGLPLLGIGVIWMAGLYFASKLRAKPTANPYSPPPPQDLA